MSNRPSITNADSKAENMQHGDAPKQADADASAPARKISGPVDALELWAAEASELPRAVLKAIRLDRNERLIIPFTSSLVRQIVHYLESQAIRGYVTCHRDGCLLCRLGFASDERDLLPVYDAIERAVGILPISPNVRPNALRPQMIPILEKVAQGEPPLVVSIAKVGFMFRVATAELPQDAEDGAAMIKEFVDQYESGNVDPREIYPTIPNEELARIPEITARLRTKGIDA